MIIIFLQTLDIETGKYTTLYTVPNTYSDPKFGSLNAAGVNPVDNKTYATMNIGSETTFGIPGKSYVVRFDQNAIEVLGMPKGRSYAGDFDSDGNYYHFVGNIMGIYKISGQHFDCCVWMKP